MTRATQHLTALILFAFVAMITDLSGLHDTVADDTIVSMTTACHGAEMPADPGHDQPCDQDSVLPCHLCAVIGFVFFDAAAEEPEAFTSAALAALEDPMVAGDPDPPKANLL